MGAAAAIAGATHPATAVAITDVSAHVAASPLFLHLLHSDLALSLTVHRVHARELCDNLNRTGNIGGLIR